MIKTDRERDTHRQIETETDRQTETERQRVEVHLIYSLELQNSRIQSSKKKQPEHLRIEMKICSSEEWRPSY